jgi:hypothetical protein
MQLTAEAVFMVWHDQIKYNTIIHFCQEFTWIQICSLLSLQIIIKSGFQTIFSTNVRGKLRYIYGDQRGGLTSVYDFNGGL